MTLLYAVADSIFYFLVKHTSILWNVGMCNVAATNVFLLPDLGLG